MVEILGRQRIRIKALSSRDLIKLKILNETAIGVGGGNGE